MHRTPVVVLYKFTRAHCAPVHIHFSFHAPSQSPYHERLTPRPTPLTNSASAHTHSYPRSRLFVFVFSCTCPAPQGIGLLLRAIFALRSTTLRMRPALRRTSLRALYFFTRAPRHNAFDPCTRAPRATAQLHLCEPLRLR